MAIWPIVFTGAILLLALWVTGPKTEGYQDFYAQVQALVQKEYTNFYKPVETGYLYLLDVLSKDPDFIQLSQAISPAARCAIPPPAFPNYGISVSNLPGGWFYENGPAYKITPTDLQKLEAEGQKCMPDPNLLKLLAEQIWLINTNYQMIPFFINSKRYLGADLNALPPKGMETYIFTLRIMVGIGQSIITKLKNTGKNINIAAIKAAAKAKEPFDNCCKPLTAADLNAWQQRLSLLDSSAAEFKNILEQWAKVESELRGLFTQLDSGLSEDTLKTFGFDEFSL